MDTLSRSRILFKVQQDLVNVKITLGHRNPDHVFRYEVDSININGKTLSPLLFDSYSDYKLVKDFYEKISERHTIFMNNETSEGAQRKSNKECADSARNALNNIKWQNYHLLNKISKEKKTIAMILGVVVPGLGHIYLKNTLRGILILLSSPYMLVLGVLYAIEYFSSISLYDQFMPAGNDLGEIARILFLLFLAWLIYIIIWLWQIRDLKENIFQIENSQIVQI